MDCPACHHANIEGARFCAKCGALLPASAEPENDPLIGTIVGGRFRIVNVLGEGGMGRVYRGEQQMGTSVRQVAVKTLLAQYARDPQVLARFMRECGTVSELEHPNTIKVYDFGQTPTGELYIAMELLTGKSLESVLETGGALPPERVDRIVAQVCGSLQEAHDKGIIHRDLKPANIQLSVRAGEEDYVKVLDFGIAKRDERTSKSEQKLTQQGTVLGTPPYMSPEQFTGTELDARSDIYSLGIMVYEMLTGRLPFDADTPWAWASQHMTAQPFPFETSPAGATVPPKMKAAVMRALQKDKNARQSTVREFYAELTLGAARPSMLGVGTRPVSYVDSSGAGAAPSGPTTGAVQSRPGQTQIGEPLFVTGPQASASRTMIDDGPSAAAVSGAMPMQTGQMAGQPYGQQQAPYGQQQAPYGQQQAPYGQPGHGHPTTGSGQVFPAPPTAPTAKKSPAPIIAAAAVAAVLVIGGGVMLLGGNKGKDKDADPTAIALPSGSATVEVASDPIPTSTAMTDPTATSSADPKATTAGTGKTNTTAPTTTGTTAGTGTAGGTKVNDEACQKAIGLATGGNTALAVNHYRNCSGPSKAAAKAAIDGSASRAVARLGCRAKGDAQAAASIGANSGMNALKAKNCPP
jgi:serine/threonine-protein kinase